MVFRLTAFCSGAAWRRVERNIIGSETMKTKTFLFLLIYSHLLLVACNTPVPKTVESEENKNKETKIISTTEKITKTPQEKKIIKTPQEGDLVFEATVEELVVDSSVRHNRWIVKLEIKKLKFGNFKNKFFSFRIHSPSKSGIEKGKRYLVHAQKIKTGFKVDPHNWRDKEIKK
jgi:hypothetical protein